MDKWDFEKQIRKLMTEVTDDIPKRELVIMTGTAGHKAINDAVRKDFLRRLSVEYVRKLSRCRVPQEEIDVVINYVDQDELELAEAICNAAIARQKRK